MRWLIASVAAGVLLFTAAPAAALEVHVKEIKAVASMLRASIELRDLIPDRFKRLLDQNGALHLRIQAELWESRPVWDRLVYPAVVRVIRMTPSAPPADPTLLDLEIGKNDRIIASSKYYLHVVATLGTIAERDADDVGDAVFGREGESNTLGSLGRLVFRTALQISDYLQSESSEAKSRRVNGADLKR
jgi:hypothetical protein